MATEKYIGQKCILCQEVLKKDDDIVICPDCGSPYHRDCYKKEGQCINTSLHEKGEDWKPERIVDNKVFVPLMGEVEVAPATDDIAHSPVTEGGVASYQEEYTKSHCPICGNETNPKDAFCPKCGTQLNVTASKTNLCPVCHLENRPNSVFCEHCGAPLDMEKATTQGGFYTSPFINIQQFRPATDVDGNTVEEYTRYVGGKFFSFIPKFLKFAKQGSKVSFNLWAFIFPQFYFFYRKMTVAGVVSLALTIILSVPSIFEYMATAGLLSSSLLNNEAFVNIAMVFYMLTMVFKFACGAFADRIYYNKAKTDIGKIKQTVLEPEARKQSISAKGGTSWTGVLVASTVMVIINIGIMLITAASGVL